MPISNISSPSHPNPRVLRRMKNCYPGIWTWQYCKIWLRAPVLIDLSGHSDINAAHTVSVTLNACKADRSTHEGNLKYSSREFRVVRRVSSGNCHNIYRIIRFPLPTGKRLVSCKICIAILFGNHREFSSKLMQRKKFQRQYWGR